MTELQELITETVALFRGLRATGDAMHREIGVTSSMRGVLNTLVQHGPKTVPQLARMRPVSRQHIQKVVNSLLDEGLVQYTENPDHKRSKLVQLTTKGTDVVRAMSRRERRILGRLAIEIGSNRLRETAQTLHHLRRLLNEPEFRHMVESGK